MLVSSSFSMFDSVAEDNIAHIGGGGILAETSMISISTSQFYRHRSSSGATVNAIGSDVSITGCSFANNGIGAKATSLDDITYQGGVIYLSSSSTLQSVNSNYDSNAVCLFQSSTFKMFK